MLDYPQGREYKLHLLDSCREYEVNQLPVVAQGTFVQCKEYAYHNGYRWKKDQSLFGGYFSHPDTGECLLINIV